MKNKKLHLFTFIILVLLSTSLDAQNDKTILNDRFSILFNKKKNQFKLECKSGCDWKELTFKNRKNKKPYLLNKAGISKISKTTEHTNNDSSDFKFIVKTTKDKMFLTSKNGTAWTNLSFTILKEKQYKINYFGVALIH